MVSFKLAVQCSHVAASTATKVVAHVNSKGEAEPFACKQAQRHKSQKASACRRGGGGPSRQQG